MPDGSSSATRRRGAHVRGRDVRDGHRARPRRRVASVLGAAAVVVIAAVSVGVEFANTVRTTSLLSGPVLDNQYHINATQFACLQGEIRRDVPKGASFYTGGPRNADDAALVEYATPWATPTWNRRAPWELALSKGPCWGVGVVAHRR